MEDTVHHLRQRVGTPPGCSEKLQPKKWNPKPYNIQLLVCPCVKYFGSRSSCISEPFQLKPLFKRFTVAVDRLKETCLYDLMIGIPMVGDDHRLSIYNI